MPVWWPKSFSIKTINISCSSRVGFLLLPGFFAARRDSKNFASRNQAKSLSICGILPSKSPTHPKFSHVQMMQRFHPVCSLHMSSLLQLTSGSFWNDVGHHLRHGHDNRWGLEWLEMGRKGWVFLWRWVGYQQPTTKRNGSHLLMIHEFTPQRILARSTPEYSPRRLHKRLMLEARKNQINPEI